METSWKTGYDKYKEAPEHRKIVFKTIIENLLVELDNKHISTIKALQNWYNNSGTECCSKMAKSVAPNNSWAWDLSIILECTCAMQCSKIYKAAKNKKKTNTGVKKIELD